MYGTEIACEWSLSAGPTLEPLTIQDAKDHARITHAREDSLIQAYITAARQSFESWARRAVLTQTWVAKFGAFADVLPLPMAAPLQTTPTAPVVQYYDTSGVLQTLATSYYLVNTTTEPGQLERGVAQTWPVVQWDRPFPVTVTYVAGWASIDDVPEAIKQGLRMAVAAADADRLGMGSGAYAVCEALWGPYRVYRQPVLC